MVAVPPLRLSLPWLTLAALAACSGDRVPDSDEVHRLVSAELGTFHNGAVLQDLKLLRGKGGNYTGSGLVPGIGRIGVEVDVHEKVLSYRARLIEPAANQGLHETREWAKTGEIRVPQ